MSENSEVVLESIEKQHNIVKYHYKSSGNVTNYLSNSEAFWIEFDEDISQIPDAVLAIPFVGNMLPLGILFDTLIHVPALDADFINAIPNIIRGYQHMYEDCPPLSANVYAAKVIQNEPHKTDQGVLFFSGGADSIYSLIKHAEHKEIGHLFQVHGADIPYNNLNAWERAKAHTEKIKKEFAVYADYVRCNLHSFVEEGILDAYVNTNYHDGFWHGFQHSIGMMTLSAPLIYKYGYRQIYFASTYAAESSEKITCASHPSIDNEVHFCGCSVKHDGYEVTRIEKIKEIGRYVNRKKAELPLRVCYLSKHGDNCCNCKKCTRTAMELFAIGEDPSRFGLNYSKEQLAEAVNTFAYTDRKEFYEQIHDVLKEFRSEAEIPCGIKGIYNLPFDEWWAPSLSVKRLLAEYENLKNWTDELQSAKNWIEGEYYRQKEDIEALNAWNKELQSAKAWLESEYFRLSKGQQE